MSRYTNPVPQYLDGAGKTVPNGLLYFYETGTTTLKNIYADSALSIPNTNPVVLRGDGSVPNIFLNGNYKVRFTDSDGVQIWERDPVGGLALEQWGDWDSTNVYNLGQVVLGSDGNYYISIIPNNQNQNPVSSPGAWSLINLLVDWNSLQTYAADDLVIYQSNIYKSLQDSNQGNVPSVGSPFWGVTIDENLYIQPIANLASVRSLNTTTDGAIIYMRGRISAGDGGEGHFKWDSSDLSVGVAVDINSEYYIAPDSDLTGTNGAWVRLDGAILNDAVVLIPSGFSTLQDAIDTMKDIGCAPNAHVDLLIEAGHALTAGLKCTNGDYSRFRIKSIDATVSLDASFVGVSAEADEIVNSSAVNNELFLAVNANFPELRCKIDMGSDALLGDGLNLANSKAFVDEACGVINAGNRGCVVWNNSDLSAYSSIWDGANDEGVRIQQVSKANLRLASADNCLASPSSGVASIYISRSSLVELRGGSAENSGLVGLLARRSIVTANECSFNGAAGTACVQAESGAVVDLSTTTCNNGVRGVWCTSGAKVVGPNQATGNSAIDLYVANGGFYTNVGVTTNSSGSAPDPSDTNIGIINKPSMDGVIWSTNADDFRVVGSDANGWWVKWSDGRMEYHSEVFTEDVTVANGAFSGILTEPVISEAFTDVQHISIQAVGRTTIGGGGERVAVDIYNRPNVLADGFKIMNTGVQLDGAGTGRTINSVQSQISVFGEWK